MRVIIIIPNDLDKNINLRCDKKVTKFINVYYHKLFQIRKERFNRLEMSKICL